MAIWGWGEGVHGKLQHSRNHHCDHEPPWFSPSPLEERAGDTKAIWNLVIGAFLGFGVWDLELRPAGSWRGVRITVRPRLAPPDYRLQITDHLTRHRLGIVPISTQVQSSPPKSSER